MHKINALIKKRIENEKKQSTKTAHLGLNNNIIIIIHLDYSENYWLEIIKATELLIVMCINTVCVFKCLNEFKV